MMIVNMDFLKEMKALDKEQTGKLHVRLVFDFLSESEIYIEKFQREAILQLLRAENDMIDYYILDKLINGGEQRKAWTKKDFVKDSQIIRPYAEQIRRTMKKNYMTIPRLFGENKEGRILLKDFLDALAYIGFKEETYDKRRLIELLKDDEEGKHISL